MLCLSLPKIRNKLILYLHFFFKFLNLLTVFISHFPEKSIEAQPAQFVEKMPRPFKKRGGAAGLGAETGRKKTGDGAADAVQNSPRVTRSANRREGGGSEEHTRSLQRPTPVSSG